ncbi:C-type lectin domain family 4 member E-like isoform X2 [Clupea harengus]|uniref:C-type lectin domain family 4 member E-like isoform X2 n=1 Tax=Clupea harengus TaxID=7950 RepID=A0A6P8GHF9_CLUHA|nr:C-type lectin domain family 4 member E-like isoform X2 [Clupea harengus]
MPGSEEIYQNMPSKASKVKIPQEQWQPDHGKHHRNDQHSTSNYLESQGRNHGCTHTNMLLLSLCVLLLCGIIVLGVLYAIQEKTLQQQNNPGSLTGQCFDGWESFNGSCYYFSHDALNWTASRDECRSVGGHLVIIDRKETQVDSIIILLLIILTI